MSGALEGIRILELARTAPACVCTMMLSDMGAEVIKVESPPDALGQGFPGSGVSPDRSQLKTALFNPYNRNKKSIAINMKAPEGQRVVHELVKTADVLVECFRPGVMKRLGVGYETLSEINPRLIYCSMSGFGQSGPYSQIPGHDLNYLAIAGLLSLVGEPGRVPTAPLNIAGDTAGASLHAAIGILLAIVARQRTGRGQFVDISFLDGVASMTGVVPGVWQYFMDGKVPRRGENQFANGYPFYNVYETKDGKMMTLGAIEQHFWDNFCRAIGREDMLDLHFRSEIHFRSAPTPPMTKAVAELRELFKTKTCDEWFDLLTAADVTVAKVNEWDEACQDPQMLNRQMVVEVQHPEVGPVKQIGIPIKMSDTPGSIRSLAPYLGQDTDAVLSALGFSPEQVNQLKAQRVLA